LDQLTGAAYVAATEQIRTDLDNVRTAWRWSAEQGDLALLELGVCSLQDFYRTAGTYPEAIQLLEAALPAVRQAAALASAEAQPQRLLARLLCYIAQFYRLYRRLGQGQKAEACANEALELGRRLADPALQALAYHELARLAQTRVDFAAMCALSEQAVSHARQANLPHLAAESLNDLGIGVGVYTHPLASAQHFQQALECLREQPNRALEGRILSNLGLFHLVGHQYQLAHRYLQQRLTLQQLLQEREDRLLTLICLGDLWTALGAYAEAQEEYAQAQTLVQARHAPYWESWLHVGHGRLQRLRGDTAAAHTTCRLAVQVAQKDGGPTEQQWALIELGHTLADLGDRVAAGQCYHQAIALPKGVNWFFRTPDAHAGLAALRLGQSDVAAAVTHAEAAFALLTQQGLAAAGEPFAVDWTCVRAYDAAGDPRAWTVLAAAYQALCETANQLEDQRLRGSFLENVVVNRQLVAAAQAAGIG
jgi:tetratricopeptide (TPR) repeat protein